MIKRMFFLLTVVVLGIALSAMPSRVAAQKPIELKAVAAWALSGEDTRSFHHFIEVVNKTAQEKKVPITIKKLGGPEVVGATQQFAAIRSGTVDMVFSAGEYFIGETPELGAMGCVRPDYVTYFSALRETKFLDVVNEACRQKSGAMVLFPHSIGQGQTILSTKSFKPGDWSGLKIRSAGGTSAVGIPAMGAASMLIASAEIFDALQRGIVDAIYGAPCDRYAHGERGVYKYMLMPMVNQNTACWFISASKWDGLPNDVKAFLKALSNDAIKESGLWYRDWNDKSIIKYIEEDSVKILWCSPEDERKIARAFRDGYMESLVKKSPTYGQKLYDIIKPYMY